MIYRLDLKKEISIEEIDENIITAGIVTLDELRQCYDRLGFSESTVFECENSNGRFRSAINIYDDYSFGLMNIVNVANVWHEKDRLAFYVKKNLFILVDIYDADKSTTTIFQNMLEQFNKDSFTLERFIYSIFDSLILNDSKALESIEFEIIGFEEIVTKGTSEKWFINKMLEMKKRLLVLHNYYEQLIDIGEILQENGNRIFDDESLRFFRIFTSRIERLNNNVQALRENLMQLREANQAAMDYNINNVMKIFTVVTTIFLPLTLIVGWYGMNFKYMPELGWKYGYAGVIILCLIVIIFCIWLFKKKKLL